MSVARFQDWDLVSTYPNAFRSLVPVFTKYTDAAFPGDDPVDTTSRVALRYVLFSFLFSCLLPLSCGSQTKLPKKKVVPPVYARTQRERAALREVQQ